MNALLGTWLFVAAFLLRPPGWQFHATWAAGALVVMVTIADSRHSRWARVVRGALGFSLMVMAFVSRGASGGPFWHPIITGGLLVLLSVAPWLGAARRRPLPNM